MAEREGFEPPIRLPVCRISSAVHSTTLPPLHQGQDGAKLRGARSHSRPAWPKQASLPDVIKPWQSHRPTPLTEPRMLTVHHLRRSQSERIVWLCEELGIDYALKCYARDPATMLAPAEYRALHPIGTAPVITEGDVVLAESGAIVQYIVAKYGNEIGRA